MTHRLREDSYVKTQDLGNTETQAKEHMETPETGRGKGGSFSIEPSEKAETCWHLDLGLWSPEL